MEFWDWKELVFCVEAGIVGSRSTFRTKLTSGLGFWTRSFVNCADGVMPQFVDFIPARSWPIGSVFMRPSEGSRGTRTDSRRRRPWFWHFFWGKEWFSIKGELNSFRRLNRRERTTATWFFDWRWQMTTVSFLKERTPYGWPNLVSQKVHHEPTLKEEKKKHGPLGHFWQNEEQLQIHFERTCQLLISLKELVRIDHHYHPNLCSPAQSTSTLIL